MTVTACLCWWNEPPRFLDRCARSLEGVADALVSADGAWQLQPDGTPASPGKQIDTLDRAASDAGLFHIKLRHHGLWTSQVAKRGTLYQRAVELTGCDWLLVIDGDEWIDHYDPKLRDELAQTTENVARIHYETRSPRLKKRELRIRRLFRGVPGITVRETHHGIVLPTGEWLHGPRRIAQAEPRDLSHLIGIAHEQSNRGKQRNQGRQDYYQARARERVEIF